MPMEPVRWMSVDEYLAGERDAEVRHEYVAGEIHAGETDRVPFSCLDAALTLDEVYEDVVFPEVLEEEEVYTV